MYEEEKKEAVRYANGLVSMPADPKVDACSLAMQLAAIGDRLPNVREGAVEAALFPIDKEYLLDALIDDDDHRADEVVCAFRTTDCKNGATHIIAGFFSKDVTQINVGLWLLKDRLGFEDYQDELLAIWTTNEDRECAFGASGLGVRWGPVSLLAGKPLQSVKFYEKFE